MLMTKIPYIRSRRKKLARIFDIKKDFPTLEESCVPFYCHPNPFMAAVAWWRPLVVGRLVLKQLSGRRVLDFGAGSGELFHHLPANTEYHFIEHDENLVKILSSEHPTAVRLELGNTRADTFDVCVCMDVLEHNPEPEDIIRKLHDSVAADGYFILCGPSENWLYKLGRFLAGYSNPRHLYNIFELEQIAAKYFHLKETVQGPLMLPIFRVSLWQKGKS